MAVSTFNASGVAQSVTSSANADGSQIYSATIPGLAVTWVDAAGNIYHCTATVQVTIDAPSGTPEPGPGNMFRFDQNGGYNVHITGADWG
ncbi:hypothetical protein [Nocardia sp. NPDC046763]|uniref:hypothetical protein n=1 Tax=Nocardia sp. NPDC046763 TaxID=3155256 RepID=UPI00340324A0